jgi:hypothetical protein
VSERLWTIRDYEPGDETEIVALFERVFKKTMGPDESLEHWRWEYLENPVGPRLIKLVWHEERLVGHYAVSPRCVVVDGEERLAALSLDTMTDPEYGRQGIFSASAEACYADMAKGGLAFVYGFPTRTSIRGISHSLKWTMVMPTPVLVKPIDVGAYVAERARVAPLGSLLSPMSRAVTRVPGAANRVGAGVRRRLGRRAPARTIEFDRFDDWADGLWESVAHQHRMWVKRDASFLRWRYDARPQSNYRRVRVELDGEVYGYAVLEMSEREQGRVCFVMDLVARVEEPQVLAALLRYIERMARSEACVFVCAMVGPKSPMRPALLRHAYLPLPERFFPQELYFGTRVMAGHEAPAIMNPGSWQLTWGDEDVL